MKFLILWFMCLNSHLNNVPGQPILMRLLLQYLVSSYLPFISICSIVSASNIPKYFVIFLFFKSSFFFFIWYFYPFRYLSFSTFHYLHGNFFLNSKCHSYLLDKYSYYLYQRPILFFLYFANSDVHKLIKLFLWFCKILPPWTSWVCNLVASSLFWLLLLLLEHLVGGFCQQSPRDIVTLSISIWYNSMISQECSLFIFMTVIVVVTAVSHQNLVF